MSLGHHHTWQPPGHLRHADDPNDLRSVNGYSKSFSGLKTPQMRASAGADGAHAGTLISESDTAADEDPRIATFRDLYKRSEAKINALFAKKHTAEEDLGAADAETEEPESQINRADEPMSLPVAPKKPARKLDDDDYDEYDDDDEEEAEAPTPPKSKSSVPSHDPSGVPSPKHRPSTAASIAADNLKEVKKETLEDIRKKLEEDKKATEEAARKSFHTMFHTLENDRDAMLDQQRLEESERQVEAEMSSQANAGSTNANASTDGYGSLSNANLGASSLTLKNLIARIDMKRNMVQASDAELRSLMSEVRKNRSKWASEDKIGQEELYEAAEKVLSELKAMTEHSSAFLTRVNKRDAPDYYTSKEPSSSLHAILC
jgi:transcriptional activator SPT7